METSTNTAPPVPLARLVGRLVQAGQLKDTHGDTVHGALIDCGEALLQSVKLPLYQDVQVMHFRSTPDEIVEYLNAGIPVKTLREVYERLRADLDTPREPLPLPASGLLGDLRRHISMMAPHQKDRRQGRLLIDAAQEIARLRDGIDCAANALTDSALCSGRTCGARLDTAEEIAKSLMRTCYDEANRLANHGSSGLEKLVMTQLYDAANAAKARLNAEVSDGSEPPMTLKSKPA